MVRKNIYKIGLFVMLVTNIALIFLMVNKPRPPMNGGEGLMGKISNKLNLTKEQEIRYFDMAKNHQKEIKKIETEQKELVKVYFNLLNTNTTDSPNKSFLIEEFKSFEAKKLEVTFQHFEDLKNLCNEEQKEQFKLIINEVTNVLTGKSQKFPPPPRGF